MKTLEAGPLPGGWQVEAHQPGERLRLSLSAPRLSHELRRRALVLPLPLVFVGLLLAWTHDSGWALKLVAWPVAAAMVGVFAVGVVALARTVRRRRQGVWLEVDRKQGVLRGVLEADFAHRAVEAPLGELESLELRVHADPGGAWASLRVKLSGGRTLQAPADARGPDTEAARALLAPVAEVLAELSGRALSG